MNVNNKIKFNGRKGQIGTTLTWMIAIFVVLFIMIIYLALVFWLRESVSQAQNEVLVEKKYGGNDTLLLNNLANLVNNNKIEDRDVLGKICRWYYVRSPGGEAVKYSQLINADDNNAMPRKAVLYSWVDGQIKKSLYMQWVECRLDAG